MAAGIDEAAGNTNIGGGRRIIDQRMLSRSRTRTGHVRSRSRTRTGHVHDGTHNRSIREKGSSRRVRGWDYHMLDLSVLHRRGPILLHARDRVGKQK